MLSAKLLGELNLQINYELYSAYLYMAMENFFQEKGLAGFANWLKVQAQEELAHARIFYEFIYRKKGSVTLEAIAKPEASFSSALDVFKKALEHEKFVTSRIDLLMSIANEEKEFATVSFLTWFVDEQVEEEESFGALVDKLELIGDNGPALLVLDAQLATRTYTVPAPLAAGAAD
ncbi:MAG: ferritin [Dehalococcoidia bacterium]|jgi:ferritin|nr:ferritin [Dehalococcoidia bacterium]